MESNGKRRSNVGRSFASRERCARRANSCISFSARWTPTRTATLFSEMKTLLQDMLGAEGSRLTNADVADVMLYFEKGRMMPRTKMYQGTIDYQRLASKVAKMLCI